MVTKVNPSVVADQVFGRRNIIINGDFRIYQRTQQATSLGAAVSYATADRWMLNGDSDGRLTMTAGTELAPPESNVTRSLKLDCTTADTSLGTSQVLTLQQRVEGYNLQHVKKGTSGAKELTASFWVKSETGNFTYVLELYDADNSRQVSKSFSVTSSWSKVELTFPADTTGAFDNDANLSLYFQIWLAAGTNYTSGTLNQTWNSITNANRAAGISNFYSSTSNELYITAIQLEVGSQATPFEIKSFGEELTLCERYFQKYTKPTLRGVTATTGTPSSCNRLGMTLRTEMRNNPSLTYGGTFSIYDGQGTGSVTNFGSSYSTTTNIEQDTISNINTVAGRPAVVYMNNDTKVNCDAEL